MQNAEFFPSKQVALKCRILFRIRNTNAEYGMVPKNTLSFQNRGLSMQNFQSIMETGSLIPRFTIDTYDSLYLTGTYGDARPGESMT